MIPCHPWASHVSLAGPSKVSEGDVQELSPGMPAKAPAAGEAPLLAVLPAGTSGTRMPRAWPTRRSSRTAWSWPALRCDAWVLPTPPQWLEKSERWGKGWCEKVAMQRGRGHGGQDSLAAMGAISTRAGASWQSWPAAYLLCRPRAPACSACSCPRSTWSCGRSAPACRPSAPACSRSAWPRRLRGCACCSGTPSEILPERHFHPVLQVHARAPFLTSS